MAVAIIDGFAKKMADQFFEEFRNAVQGPLKRLRAQKMAKRKRLVGACLKLKLDLTREEKMANITMTVNGKSVSGEVEGRTLLVDFLRPICA